MPVTRANGLPSPWSGGRREFNYSDSRAERHGQLHYRSRPGANFTCFAAASAGTFTIPPSVLLALPTGNFGGLELQAYTAYGTFSASGLNHDDIMMYYATPILTTFKVTAIWKVRALWQSSLAESFIKAHRPMHRYCIQNCRPSGS